MVGFHHDCLSFHTSLFNKHSRFPHMFRVQFWVFVMFLHYQVRDWIRSSKEAKEAQEDEQNQEEREEDKETTTTSSKKKTKRRRRRARRSDYIITIDENAVFDFDRLSEDADEATSSTDETLIHIPDSTSTTTTTTTTTVTNKGDQKGKGKKTKTTSSPPHLVMVLPLPPPEKPNIP